MRMGMKKNNYCGFFITLVFAVFIWIPCSTAQEEAASDSVALEGDQLEYVMSENKVVAVGNVIIGKDNVTLHCDRLEFFRDTKVAFAEGNVVLVRKGERFVGERLKYDFNSMKGDFLNARIAAYPFFGEAEEIKKVGENHMEMKRGYLTTCDHDKPHFRLFSKKIDIYPGEKAVARNVRMLIGNLPILYIPRYTQNLSDKKPMFVFTPGYDKDWGAFILSKWRYYFNDNYKGVVHLDYRERKDFAWGIDFSYQTQDFGEGIIRTYYMNERNITSKHVWEEKPSPTIEKERFKVEWRHKWNIDENTNAIWQYYKLSDNTLLQDYFEGEYDEDFKPNSYFLLTHNLPQGTLSLRTDVRVNRFEAAVERLPEIAYSLGNTQIGGTGLYFKNSTTYSNLVEKTASPSEVRQKTMRVHTDNEVSYPMKVAFIEFTPYVGGKQTYYSRINDPTKDNVVRNVFRTGADLSTKFYRIFDINSNFLDLDINRLRHIITPSISYQYIKDPTIPSSELDQFDGIDSQERDHSVTFSIENKLQTKRNMESVDLLRFVLGTTFNLKEHIGKGGFGAITSDIEVTPYDWLTFDMDASFDTVAERLSILNFDLYINNFNDPWYFRVGKRYNVNANDQITTEYGYIINPKWAFKVYQQFDIGRGFLKEQQYTITRDMHAWKMDISFNQTRGDGDEIWVIFTMKAFPEIGIDAGTSFNKRKAGSQAQ